MFHRFLTLLIICISLMSGLAPKAQGATPQLSLNRQALFKELMAQEQAEGSNVNHLSFLDRGLASSPYKDEVEAIAERLARPHERTDVTATLEAHRDEDPMPPRGEMPRVIAEGPFSGFSPTLHSACVAVMRYKAAGPQLRWYGRRPLVNCQFWSSTKILQAFNLVSLLNSKHPQISIASTSLSPVGGSSPRIPFFSLMQNIVSYDKGVGYSNGGSETLGRFLLRQEREAMVEAHTGHDHSFRGAYGGGSLIARPRLVLGSGQTLLTAPSSIGSTGPNLMSPYDLTRMIAMAAWHMHLSSEQWVKGAQWHSLSTVLQAMGHDSARYLDVAVNKLGLVGKIDEVVMATKLGFGISSASRKAQLTYVGTFQFRDRRLSPPITRRMCFALRGEHTNAVALDAQMAVEVTDLVRLLANGAL